MGILLVFLTMFGMTVWRLIETSMAGALGLQEMWTNTAIHTQQGRDMIRTGRINSLIELSEDGIERELRRER